MRSVEKLSLPHNELDDEAITILMESEVLPNLITLDLYRNRVSQRAAQALKNAPKLPQFKFLQMEG
ncbi:MAG: hypothetical protein GWM98_02180 [Nitrospinaceae bacterium]|nr:hypothetical protein [Nitrospinaceae bacterium]